MSRPDWTTYFIGIASAVSRRGDCRRRQVGAVLASPDNYLLATGYNGVRPGTDGCLAGKCPRGLLSYDEVAKDSSYSNCIATHAEQNCISHYAGRPAGMKMYVSDKPCPDCTKVLYNAGLASVNWPGGNFDWSVDNGMGVG